VFFSPVSDGESQGKVAAHRGMILEEDQSSSRRKQARDDPQNVEQEAQGAGLEAWESDCEAEVAEEDGHHPDLCEGAEQALDRYLRELAYPERPQRPEQERRASMELAEEVLVPRWARQSFPIYRLE
jgi:hypothetical protein